MQVDFEERVNFRRLHDYRLARTRAALAHSGLGALLCFDQHNIRYTTSTVIGEWARDKLTRYSLLTGNGDPYIWDFGSAAKHHKLYTPWLCKDHCRAGLLGMRGAVGGDGKLFRRAAREIKALLEEEGVGDMPLGVDVVEVPMMLELQKLGIDVRDAQQTMLLAREIKSIDELMLLNMAAAMVDGVYQDIAEALKPGVKESDIVALATMRLYQMGSDCVEAINAISGERCSPHPHNFTDRLIRPGDQAFFDIIHSYIGYRTCYYRTFSVGRATQPQLDAYKRARDWMDRAIALLKPGVSSEAVAASFPTAQEIGFGSRDGCLRPQLLPRPRPGPARAAADLAPEFAGGADRAQDRHGVRGRNLLPGERRRVGRAHRGRSDPHAERTEGDLAVPGAGAADRQPVLTDRGTMQTPRLTSSAGSASAAWAMRWPSAWPRPAPTSRCGTARAPRPSRWRAHGAKIARELDELAACDIVFVMVSTWDDVQRGDRRAARPAVGRIARRSMVIECSSISLEGSAELRAMLAARGVQMLAAPVSGNAKVIKAGRLSFVCSGPEGGVRCRAAVRSS